MPLLSPQVFTLKIASALQLTAIWLESKKHSHQSQPMLRTTRVALILTVVVTGLMLNAHVLNAQEAPVSPNAPLRTPPAMQPASKSDLTQGLLELLTEPAPTDKSQTRAAPGTLSPADRTTQTESAAKPNPAPAPASSTRDKDLIGEDIGSLGKHPLTEVQEEMMTAARWLRSQSPVDKTHALQRDIIARLDRLIGDLDQQQPQPAPSTSSTASNQTQQSSNPSGESSEAARQAGSQSKPADSSSHQEPSSSDPSTAAKPGDPGQPGENGGTSSPGQQGPSSPSSKKRPNVVVDLSDPTAMQRSAWGSLPDRVRDQMQSRMVERFLPAYREDIEAYYRALVK